MEITCLGSASAFPTTKRATTAYALRINFPDGNTYFCGFCRSYNHFQPNILFNYFTM